MQRRQSFALKMAETERLLGRAQASMVMLRRDWDGLTGQEGYRMEDPADVFLTEDAARRLIDWMEANRWTFRKLGKEADIDVTHAHLSGVIGRRSTPSVELCQRLAKKSGIPLDVLLPPAKRDLAVAS